MSPDVPAWVRDAVAYQIFPDRFAGSPRVPKPGRLEAWEAPPTRHGFKGGDLLGIVEHLDHLEGLGITAISLNPIFSSASNHRYHTYDYLAVDPLLGGDVALRELLDAAHARGMRVILDGVFNHASRGFWPFHHVMEAGRFSPYRHWFHFDDAALEAGRVPRPYPFDNLDELLPADWMLEHAGGTHSQHDFGYRAWWDLPALPKLNTDNPEVRDYLFGVAEHWIRFGADGWRLDVPEEIADPAFWSEFRARVRGANPEAYIVAEIWHPAPEALGGDRFDGLMNYPLLAAIIGFVGAGRLDRRVVGQQIALQSMIDELDAPAVARALPTELDRYAPASTGAMLNLLGGHDIPRLVTMCGGDVSALRLATLIQMTLPGMPCIYYGDEVGLPGEMDPDCRRAMPWDEVTWDHDLLAFVRSVVALRHAEPDLRGEATELLAAEERAVAYRRGRLVVVVNAGDEAASLPLAAGAPVSLPGWDDPVRDGERLTLAARTGAVLRT